MNTIQAAFEDLREKAIPSDASDAQIQLLRVFFYAGATAVLAIVEGIGDSSISEDAGVAMLENLKQEGVNFIEGVKRYEQSAR